MPPDARPSAALGPAQVRDVVTAAVDAVPIGQPIRVGVDVVDLVEFEHNMRVGGDRWMRKVFTDTEIAYASGRSERLATRFAAKEAVVKALGTGFRAGVSARMVEIVTDPEGRPRVVLAGAAARAASAVGANEVLVSLSREGACAAAVAWAVTND